VCVVALCRLVAMMQCGLWSAMQHADCSSVPGSLSAGCTSQCHAISRWWLYVRTPPGRRCQWHAHGETTCQSTHATLHARSHRHRAASITSMVSTGRFGSGATRTSLCLMRTYKSLPTFCCISRCAGHARDICHFAIISTEACLELSSAACRLWHRCWRWTPPYGVYLPGTTTAGQQASGGTPSAW
jgi:hypothetical protein